MRALVASLVRKFLGRGIRAGDHSFAGMYGVNINDTTDPASPRRTRWSRLVPVSEPIVTEELSHPFSVSSVALYEILPVNPNPDNPALGAASAPHCRSVVLLS
jgi:hypothetical protein